jgi:hypothetical protein
MTALVIVLAVVVTAIVMAVNVNKNITAGK